MHTNLLTQLLIFIDISLTKPNSVVDYSQRQHSAHVYSTCDMLYTPVKYTSCPPDGVCTMYNGYLGTRNDLYGVPNQTLKGLAITLNFS